MPFEIFAVPALVCLVLGILSGLRARKKLSDLTTPDLTKRN